MADGDDAHHDDDDVGRSSSASKSVSVKRCKPGISKKQVVRLMHSDVYESVFFGGGREENPPVFGNPASFKNESATMLVTADSFHGLSALVPGRGVASCYFA